MIIIFTVGIVHRASTALVTMSCTHAQAVRTALMALRLMSLVPPATTRARQDRLHVHPAQTAISSRLVARRPVSAVLQETIALLEHRLQALVQQEHIKHHLLNLVARAVLLDTIALHLDWQLTYCVLQANTQPQVCETITLIACQIYSVLETHRFFKLRKFLRRRQVCHFWFSVFELRSRILFSFN